MLEEQLKRFEYLRNTTKHSHVNIGYRQDGTWTASFGQMKHKSIKSNSLEDLLADVSDYIESKRKPLTDPGITHVL